jgi:N-acetylglucosamine kinase-like BadF-type ATPase
MQGSRERFSQSVSQALQIAWSAAGLAARPLAAVVLGATGIVAETTEAAVAAELLSTLVQAQTIHICSDAIIALHGAHAGGPGVIVISGTGTIALGQDNSGRLARAGGWGWLLGDEGSAYAIGRAGLRAALYASDKMGPATALEALFKQHFGLVSLQDVKRIIYAPDFGARGLAALAAIVSQAVEQGDLMAGQIIDQAGAALARQVVAVVQKLEFDALPVPVAPLGGAFDHVIGLRRAFANAVAAAGEPLLIVQPQLPAVLGAVIMALKQAEADLASILPRLSIALDSLNLDKPGN